MSHIPTDQEEYLAALETYMLDAPFNIRVEVTKFDIDTAHIPKGYVEEESRLHKILDTSNGMVTKEIVVYCI